MKVLPATADSPRLLPGFLAITGLFLCGYLAFGIGAYSFTQFLEPLSQEYHWGRATLGGLMSAFWLAAPCALISAYLLDRMGVRALVAIGGTIETLGMAGMMFASKAPEFYLLRFCMGVGKVLMVTPLPVMAARWFPRRPGVAIATALCGWHVGGLVMAPLAQKLIAAHGWRSALLTLSVLMAIGVFIATLLLRDPRKTADASSPSSLADLANSEVHISGNSYLNSSVLAIVAIGLGTLAFYAGYAGLLAQLSPMLADSGFNARAVAELTGNVAISAAVSVLLAGAITQWLSARISGSAALTLMGITSVLAVTLGSGVPAWRPVAVVVLLGALVGGGDPIIIDALRRSVKLNFFGRAYGWWYLLCLSALTIAPFAVGASFDYTGSYKTAFLAIGGGAFAMALAWFMTVRKT